MRIISLTIVLILLSCSNPDKINKKLIDYNDKLIDYEMNSLEELYFMFPMKVSSFDDKAHEIKRLYLKLRENLISNSNDTSSISDYLDYLHYIGQYPIEVESLKGDLVHCNLTTILIQIQNMTLYSIKNLKGQIFNTDYPTNACQIIAVRDYDNFVRLIISKIDTSATPKFLIGKLSPNENKFIDKFDSVEARRNGLNRIPTSKLENTKFIEGLLFLPRNNCTLDTIRFKSKIY